MKKIILSLFAVFVLTLAWINRAATSRGPSAGDAAPLGAVTEYQLQFSPSNTVANATTLKHGLLPTLSGDTTQFLRGDGTFVSPISQYGLTAGRIPMAFHAGADTFVDSAISQDFSGNLTHNGSHDFFAGGLFVNAARGLVNSNVAALKILRNDANQKVAEVVIGSNLSFDGTTLSASAAGGNVTATPTTGAGGHIAVFDNDAGTDIAGSAGLTWDGTTLGDGSISIFANAINTTSLIVGGQTFTGASSGTFTPVLTRTGLASWNEVASSVYRFSYSRVGNIVHASGRITINGNAGGGLADGELTLPVPSNFSAVEDATGVGVLVVPTNTQSFSMGVEADAATDQVHFHFVATAGARDYVIQYDYLVQ